MNYRNLKIHTASNLFAIIVLAMVLINCIVAIFWYEHLVKQHFTILQNTIRRNYPAIENIISSKNKATIHRLEKLLELKHYHITKIIFDNTIVSFEKERPIITNETFSKRVSIKTIPPVEETKSFFPAFFRKNRNTVFHLLPLEEASKSIFTQIHIDTSFLIRQIWNKEKIILLYIVFNAFILTTILFFRFRKTVFAPIDNLLNVANNYQLHEGIWTIQQSNSSEFDQLSQAMNAMVLRIEKDRDKLLETVNELKETNKDLKLAQQETIQAEKLASTGRLAAGFAHEIGNPVTIIQGYLELLKQNTFSESEKNDFLNRSLAEITRIDSLLFQLMDLANNKRKNECAIAPSIICDELITTLKSTLSKNNISVSLHTTNSSLLIFCDPELFRQVLLNLFLNSIDAILARKHTEPGEIHCTFKNKDLDNTRHVFVQFEDNGVGIENNDIDMIFDPFFTTKSVGEGTGLGLSVSHRIIGALNGHIEVQSSPSKGTKFSLFIPQYFKDNVDE